MTYRTEHDMLGEVAVPSDAYWGAHTQRARENFSLAGQPVRGELIRAYARVKKACAAANGALGYLPVPLVDVITGACDEIIAGQWLDQFPVDALQGGAGTSLNMNLNEVIANRAAEKLGGKKGQYDHVHPLDHVNLHQSTNDTFPTALRLAVIVSLHGLAAAVAGLQGAFQRKEQEYAALVKIGRTELQEAVPMTLGAQFGGFAEAFGRDRWRTFKCEERIRTVTLGTTAVGTGLCAPREYIFLVIETLRAETGLGLARAENGVDQTANADAFVEVAGMLDALAVNLIKTANDLRLLNLLGEIAVAPVQAGSSLMPGKVNPVVLESVVQGGMRAMADMHMVRHACASGSQQINEFLPVVAQGILEGMGVLERACRMYSGVVDAITAGSAACTHFVNESTAILTAFLPLMGYDKVMALIRDCRNRAPGESVRDFLDRALGAPVVARVLSSRNLTSLGYEENDGPSVST